MTAPTDHRPPRLAIFTKPARRRYKIYVVGRHPHRNSRPNSPEKRVAACDQPFHGFKMLDDARTALSAMNPEKEIEHFLRSARGTVIPANEQEVQ